MTVDRETLAPTWLELESVVPLESDNGTSGKSVTSLSADSLKRNYPEAIVEISPRRVGIKLRDALAIADGSYRPPPPLVPELRQRPSGHHATGTPVKAGKPVRTHRLLSTE